MAIRAQLGPGLVPLPRPLAVEITVIETLEQGRVVGAAQLAVFAFGVLGIFRREECRVLPGGEISGIIMHPGKNAAE